MKSFWPEIEIADGLHPAASFPIQEKYDGSQVGLGLIVRNPVDRFISMAGKSKVSPDRLIRVNRLQPLPQGDFRYFKFETQLQECADWLGITEPLQVEDALAEEEKPVLNEYQLEIVRGIYAKDIELWESL